MAADGVLWPQPGCSRYTDMAKLCLKGILWDMAFLIQKITASKNNKTHLILFHDTRTGKCQGKQEWDNLALVTRLPKAYPISKRKKKSNLQGNSYSCVHLSTLEVAKMFFFQPYYVWKKNKRCFIHSFSTPHHY
jgi:hypothetical protein